MLKNRAIEPYWNKVRSFRAQELPDDLADIVHSEFVEVFGALSPRCLVLPEYVAEIGKQKDFGQVPSQTWNSVQDRTGFECSLSKIHIDEMVEKNHFEFALLFVCELFREFNRQFTLRILRGIISVDNDADDCFSCCVRFHVKRSHEWWIDEEVEHYSEGVLVIDSNELSLLYPG